MAIATRAYILKHNTPLSNEYANTTAQSCDRVEIPWEYHEGFSGIRDVEAWNSMGLFDFHWDNTGHKLPQDPKNRAGLCSAGHVAIWQKIIAGEDEAAIILEHDAVMLHKPNIAIPNDVFVALGYRTNDLTRYKHLRAGPPTELKEVSGHNGSHAYAITKHTAQKLVEQIKESKGPLGCIDSFYFRNKSTFNIMITDPISAIAWVRESSIWSKPSNGNHLPLLKSYVEYNK